MPTPPTIHVNQANALLGDADADQVVRWAADTFGEGLVMTSSFGAQAAVMLHLVTRVVPRIPVILLDTGYLFPETYHFVETLTRRLDLNLKVFNPAITAARMEAVHGRLWEMGVEGLEKYGQITKVEPLTRAIRELNATAWLSGVRAQQTRTRESMSIVGSPDGYGIYPVHPILKWTTKDVHNYLKKHDLPYHPLYDKGYASIGDTHSTSPIGAGEDERSGRFGGLKQECGLHIPTSSEEIKSREGSSL